MADTVLTELKIHEFDSVEQMSQYESEIGENDIVYTPDTSIRLPILTPMWFDHQVNDESWLNADTFSWQPSARYKQTYEHLVDDAFSATINGEKYYAWDVSILSGIRYYTKSFTPNQGDIVYEKSGTGEMVATGYTVTSVAGNELTLSDGSIVRADIKFVFTDTIGDITITYYQAKDGHRICLPDQESNLVALYEATGVAWYYILDADNQQFKLPRTKWGFTGLRDSVGGYVEPTLPNIKGGQSFSNVMGFPESLSDRGEALYTTSDTVSKYFNSSSSTASRVNGFAIDASRASAIYQDGATVQPPATQMHLYFWVGTFDQTATEQTAGLNAELFNKKIDLPANKSQAEVDFVIASQLPTADNGYTWYRKYKSGWVEQGGMQQGSASVSTGTEASLGTITLPVPMATDTYYANASGGEYCILMKNDATQTTIKFTFGAYSATRTLFYCKWRVAGYAE